MLDPTLSATRRGAIVRAPSALAFVLALLCTSALLGAERPRIYAITGGTIVPAPGEQIESGTIVIRDGLIESVGADVDVPPDAVEIDATERWIYPGLIDADSQLGIAAARDSSDRSQAGDGSGGSRDTTTPPGAVHPIL
jgi:hypothetical protein